MKHISAQSLIYFTISAVLTGLGFFLEYAPFIMAYIPLGIAICLRERSAKLWLIAGHFFWVAVISGWGLYQLGYDPVIVSVVTVIVLGSGSWLMAYLGVGISAGLLSLIPFFPANPLLVTGAVLPGFGSLGLFLLLIIIVVVETLHSYKWRVCILLGTLIFGQSHIGTLVSGLGKGWATAAAAPLTAPEATYTELDTSSFQAITRAGRWAQIAAAIEPGTTVILGENIFDHTDLGASSYWCRVAREKATTLYIGVSGEGSVGEVWRFDTNNCVYPTRIYRAEVGIPMITGGWWFNTGPEDSAAISQYAPHSGRQWLACVEAFSLSRWVQIAHFTDSVVVIVSNDALTKPLPTGVLRRKVGQAFAALLKIQVVHADTGRNILHVTP